MQNCHGEKRQKDNRIGEQSRRPKNLGSRIKAHLGRDVRGRKTDEIRSVMNTRTTVLRKGTRIF